MRPLRYSINITLDGCCDHRAGVTDEELHRYWAENLAQADALLFGRVTYEMMEEAWRLSTRTVAMPDWTEPFARTIDAAKANALLYDPWSGISPVRRSSGQLHDIDTGLSRDLCVRW